MHVHFWGENNHSSGCICYSALNSNSFSTIVHIYQPQRIHGNLTLCAPQVQCSGVLLVMCCHVWNFKMVGANELIIGSIVYMWEWNELPWFASGARNSWKEYVHLCIDHKASKCHSYPIWRISQYFLGRLKFTAWLTETIALIHACTHRVIWSTDVRQVLPGSQSKSILTLECFL